MLAGFLGGGGTGTPHRHISTEVTENIGTQETFQAFFKPLLGTLLLV